MENDNKRPMRYYAAIGGTVIGGILTVAGGFTAFRPLRVAGFLLWSAWASHCSAR